MELAITGECVIKTNKRPDVFPPDKTNANNSVLHHVMRRLSVQSVEDDEPITAKLFRQKSFLPKTLVHDGEDDDKSCKAKAHFATDDVLPSKGLVSISTAFLAVFLLFVTLLGASLMIVSAKYSAETNALSSQGTDSVQTIYLNLIERSNSRLINASNYSMSVLTELVSKQITKRVQAAVVTYTGWAQMVVGQMTDMMENGELDVVDLDITIPKLWRLAMEYPSLGDVIFSGADNGVWIVAMTSNDGIPHDIAIRNTSDTICRCCLPGATGLNFYSASDPSNHLNLAWNFGIPLDPRERPWYKIGMAANGTGAWTPPYVFVEDDAVGVTAVKMARGKDGRVIGVLGADLTMAGMTRFLRDLKLEVDTVPSRRAFAKEDDLLTKMHFVGELTRQTGSGDDHVKAQADAISSQRDLATGRHLKRQMNIAPIRRIFPEGSHAKVHADTFPPLRRSEGDDDGFQLVLIHENGDLLASSEEVTPLRDGKALSWQEAVNASNLRTALQSVWDYWGGSFRPFFETERPGAFRKYQDPKGELFVMTMHYLDGWGLRMMLLSAVPNARFRRHLDAEMAATIASVAAERRNASQLIAEVRSEVADTVRRNWTVQLLISFAVLGGGSVVVFLFAVRISRTLRKMAAEMRRVAMLDFSDRSMYRSHLMDEVIAISRSFAIMDMNLLSFSRYVPENVVRLLTRKGTVAHLGVAPREVSIMFSDVVGFTTIAEELSPECLISLLAQYLEAMSDCIEESGGTVGKYIGDAIMAFWNSPTAVVDHPNVACACALEQQRRLKELRQRWDAEGYPPIHMRLGLSTGTALHGNVGSQKRMEWTLIGDEVNLASRLEGMGKHYGVSILISGAMHDRVCQRFLARPVDRVVAVGKRRPVDVYELVAERCCATETQRKYCDDFAEVVGAYRGREFGRARELAVAFAGAFPEDTSARQYVQRCEHFSANPPGEEWDGTFVLTSK